MPTNEKAPPTSKWAEIEGRMSSLGKTAWQYAIVGIVIDLVVALVALNYYNIHNQLAWINRTTPTIRDSYQASATGMAVLSVLNFAFAGACVFLVAAYVFKPFGPRCASSDWEPLVHEKLFDRIPKLWLVALVLAGASYLIGGIGVLVPALELTLNGPGKGRIFGGK
ncbi:MAG: hypothetical protein JW839_15015 [Candidatus Lokiarchaeota archaeon]|nr:hypothetical protein [Candidatus Lokiarchaeota archaeon]